MNTTARPPLYPRDLCPHTTTDVGRRRIMGGIRIKLLGYTALIMLLVSSVLTVYAITTQRTQSLAIYRNDAEQITRALSEALLNDLYQLDMRGLRLHLRAARENSSVVATLVLDEQGRILTDGTKENVRRGHPLDDPFVPRVLASKKWVMDVREDLLKIGRPIQLEEAAPLGWLYLHLSLKELNQRIQRQWRDSLLISSLCVVLGFLGAGLFATRFTRPITELTRVADQVRTGDETVEIPVIGKDEIRCLSISLDEMLQRLRTSDRELRDLNQSLDTRIKERTLALEEALRIVRSSITYASHIQHSILPSETQLDRMFPNHFIVWEPRDTVGGDMYWCRRWGTGRLLIVGDCTGHGVPGAFMTLIANGALGHALRATQPGHLERLISAMHRNIQEVLKHSQGQGGADDGLELGACLIPDGHGHLLFAGARFALFYHDPVGPGDNPGQPVTELKGNRTGIGYRDIPADISFTEHHVPTPTGRRFVLTSDGIIDQVGGERRRGFGKKRFMALLVDHQTTPIQAVGAHLVEALKTYQANEVRRDDVTIIGFTV